MRRTTALLLAVLATAACSDAATAPPTTNGSVGAAIVDGDVMVTNSNDAGAGSFRDAIEQANSDASIASIAFLPDVNTIALQSGIVFSGTQNLTINANHATLDAAAAGAGVSAFVATGGGDLAVIGLTVRNAGGQGVEIQVPVGAMGTVRVTLNDVHISGNAGHGFLVDDQVNNSDATVDVTVTDSRFIGNGYSVSDRDGIRVNEGGVGSIMFVSWNSLVDDNAADGIELDETGAGDVTIDVRKTTITRNGIFDPADLDDGFDIDEAGDGHILGQVTNSSANHNYEEGLDFNENDAGDLRVDLTDVEANYNREEGIDLEEDDDFAGGGDLVTRMNRVTTHGNGVDGGDGGIKIREKGVGDLDVEITNAIASRNSDAGIHARETEAGDARVTIEKAVTNGNAGNGIEIRESSSGSVTHATFTDITTSGNGTFGLSVDNGIANISGVKGGANGSGLTGGGAIFAVIP